jgi:hypothetical protein
MEEMKHFVSYHFGDLAKGVAAVGASTFAVITSAQEQAEWWMRIATLIAAFCVSVLTAWSIWRKNRSS